MLLYVSRHIFFNDVFMEIVCTLWGGLMSGLTVGLLSIDKLELELKVKTGEKVEKDRVSRNSFEI